MKPILININEMSDSREVYDSKPNIFFTIFIYTILALFVVAFLWMYFGHIDVVVKSDGMLRPNNQVATVMNTYSGTLETVGVEDGSSVKEGDTLYIIEHGDLQTELNYYEEQLEDTENTLTLLDKYKQSIEVGVNHFTKTELEEEYYLKYQAFELNYEMAENDYAYSEKERVLNLNAVSKQLGILKEKLSNTELLKKAVTNGNNLFANTGEGKEYYNIFMKYQSDFDSFISQYDNAKEDISNSTKEEGLVNSLEYYEGVRKGLQQLKASINQGESVFDKTNNYSLQYEEYVNQIANLTSAYEQSKEDFEINIELEGLAVTEWEVQQSKATMEEAERAIDTYEVNYLANITTNIKEVEQKLEEIKLSKENTVSKDVLYDQNEAEKTAALDNYKIKYLVELDNTIASIKENISSLEANRSSLELKGEQTLIYKDKDKDVEAKLVEYHNSELQTTITNINSYTDKQRELQTNINKINTQIDQTVVKATKSGVINSSIELVTGDVLSSGTEVLTIIPEDNSEYKVSIYVSNEDIGKLRIGMEAKFNIYALPNREYGYLTGTITNISKDLKVDQSSGSGYYLVEAKLNNKTVYDAQGKKGTLKAGMTCEAQMITESKRILTYVLEKIDLWID